jgi:hypothetical protein
MDSASVLKEETFLAFYLFGAINLDLDNINRLIEDEEDTLKDQESLII